MELPTGFLETTAHGFYIVTRPVYHKLALSIAERDPERVLTEAAPSGAPAPLQGRGPWIELRGEGADTIIFKKQRRGGLYARLRGDIHRDDYRAVSEVFLSETAWKKGVPVALTAFALSGPAGEGRMASYRRGYCASIKLPGARSLMDWLSSPATTQTERRLVMAAAAQAVGRAHDRGFQHADLNLGNILVVRSEQGDYTGWLIDLAGSRLSGTLRFKPRLENLARLYRSAEKWMPATPGDAGRRRFRQVVFFLRAYTARERGMARRYLEAAGRYRASLLIHRLGWKLSRPAIPER